MQPAGPKIETTGDILRIEFPGRRNRAVRLVGISYVPVLWYLFIKSIGGPQARDVVEAVFLLSGWICGMWYIGRRYTVLLSEKSLAVRQQAFGIRWTKRYALTEIHNLHLRYNPIVGKPPRQWELIFDVDRKKLLYSVPVPMTLPDAQNIKITIYSRFPQLAPAHPFFWQV